MPRRTPNPSFGFPVHLPCFLSIAGGTLITMSSKKACPAGEFNGAHPHASSQPSMWSGMTWIVLSFNFARPLAEKYWGGLLDQLDRDDEADVHYSRARALDEKRYARDPDNRGVQFDLAIDLANSATIAEGAGRVDDAYALYSRSLEMRQKLWASDPRDVRTKGRVGYVRTRLALLEIRRGHASAGIEHAKQAVTILQSVADQTADAATRRELGDAVAALARAERASGRIAAGCESAQRALKTFEALPPSELDHTASDELVARMIQTCCTGTAPATRGGQKRSN